VKLSAERGLVLGKIVPDSPAAKAGLKENDVVTESTDSASKAAAQFRRMIHEIPASRSIQLTVWRDGARCKPLARLSVNPKSVITP